MAGAERSIRSPRSKKPGSAKFPTARHHPHRARIGAAQLRWQRITEQDVRNSPPGSRRPPAPRKFRSSSPALSCRTSPACRSLVDLAAMRSAVARLGKEPKIIEPLVPVDLVVDHPCRSISPAPPTRCSRTWKWNSSATASATNSSSGASRRSNLQSRSARHRHRAPGQSRIPRQGRAVEKRRASTIPTPWSAPTRTPR